MFFHLVPPCKLKICNFAKFSTNTSVLLSFAHCRESRRLTYANFPHDTGTHLYCFFARLFIGLHYANFRNLQYRKNSTNTAVACFAVFLLIISPGRAHNSQDCELIRPFDSLKMLIKTKKNISC